MLPRCVAKAKKTNPTCYQTPNEISGLLKLVTLLSSKKKLGLNLTLASSLNKKNRHNKFSVLTSPNANKNAQEQFLFQTYSTQLTVFFLLELEKFLVLLKKIKRFLFSDIKIQLLFFLMSNLTQKIARKTLNPESFRTKALQFNSVPPGAHLQKYKKVRRK